MPPRTRIKNKGVNMKIKVNYIESNNNCEYEMRRAYNGVIMNCGGRAMPF